MKWEFARDFGGEKNIESKQYNIGDVVWAYDPMWGILPYKISGVALKLSSGDDGGCTSEMYVDVHSIGKDFWESAADAHDTLGQ